MNKYVSTLKKYIDIDIDIARNYKLRCSENDTMRSKYRKSHCKNGTNPSKVARHSGLYQSIQNIENLSTY